MKKPSPPIPKGVQIQPIPLWQLILFCMAISLMAYGFSGGQHELFAFYSGQIIAIFLAVVKIAERWSSRPIK